MGNRGKRLNVELGTSNDRAVTLAHFAPFCGYKNAGVRNFAHFAPFLTRHLVRHSTECEGGSSKSDGWFAAKYEDEARGFLRIFAANIKS